MIWKLVKWAQQYTLYPVFFVIPRWWAVLLALYGGYEQQQMERYLEASRKIAAGDSEAHVVSILGQPVARFDKRSKEAAALFGSVPRKWAYGSALNLDYLLIRDLPFPNPVPIKIRLWSPQPEDLTIDWGENDTVLRVVKPKK